MSPARSAGKRGDAGGMRVITQTKQSNGWFPALDPDSGSRTYYVYDGSDIAMTLIKGATGSYNIRQRFLSGGVDQPLAGRFSGGPSGTLNLALIADRGGSTVAAVKPTGLQEFASVYFTRDAFGNFDQSSGTGSGLNTETGFAGASTPSQTGGFTYLRNRWYDPKTGRFLTQDPIGLAGGVNLYSYAGNNPVAFDDPFGTCDKPKGKGVGVCVEGFIAAKLGGVGDNRGPRSDGGTNKFSASFTINPKTGELTNWETNLGNTATVHGLGGVYVSNPVKDKDGNWHVGVSGAARTALNPALGNIDFQFDIRIKPDGSVSTAGGTHDGYPSYEVWQYPENGSAPKLIYHHREKNQRDLYGCCDTKVPNQN